MSQDNGQVLPSRNQKSPYQGFRRSEVHVRRVRIRIVSHRVVCVHSVGLGSCLFARVFCFTDSHGSTLYIFLYLSLGK